MQVEIPFEEGIYLICIYICLQLVRISHPCETNQPQVGFHSEDDDLGRCDVRLPSLEWPLAGEKNGVQRRDRRTPRPFRSTILKMLDLVLQCKILSITMVVQQRASKNTG